MLGRDYPGEECSAAKALGLVGERWSLLILRDAMFRGLIRFGEFQKSLGLASNVLASRLTGFVASGLMRVERDPSDTRQKVYRLTEEGLDLKPVIIALTEWGDRWLGDGPVVFVDANGQRVRLKLMSSASGHVTPMEVSASRRSGSDEKEDLSS